MPARSKAQQRAEPPHLRRRNDMGAAKLLAGTAGSIVDDDGKFSCQRYLVERAIGNAASYSTPW